jgi:predicted phage tail protein
LNLAAVTTGTHTLQVTLPGPVTTLADFGVDRDPPRSVASSPPAVQSPAFNVTLSGADDVSGVSRFRVQYRVGATGAWIAWLERSATWDYETGDASDLSPTFGPTEPVVVTRGTTYYFRVRAVDAAGNWETPHAAPDTATTYQSGRLYLPLVLRR